MCVCAYSAKIRIFGIKTFFKVFSRQKILSGFLFFSDNSRICLKLLEFSPLEFFCFSDKKYSSKCTNSIFGFLFEYDFGIAFIARIRHFLEGLSKYPYSRSKGLSAFLKTVKLCKYTKFLNSIKNPLTI